METDLYVLKEANRPSVKIGISQDVDQRGASLFEEIDWASSRYVTFPNRELAKATEGYLHAKLSQLSTPKKHGLSGFTEWFHVDAFDLAISFIDREIDEGVVKCSEMKVPDSAVVATFRHDCGKLSEFADALEKISERKLLIGSYAGLLLIKGEAPRSGDGWLKKLHQLSWHNCQVGEYSLLCVCRCRWLSEYNQRVMEGFDKPSVSFDDLYFHSQTKTIRAMTRIKTLVESLKEVDVCALNDLDLRNLESAAKRLIYGVDKAWFIERYLKSKSFPGQHVKF